MIDQPNAQEQKAQQEKLVLPAYPYDAQSITGSQQRLQLGPEQLIRRDMTLPPTNLFAKLAYFWSKDPAYKVMMIATTTVVIAGILFLIFGSAAFLQTPNFVAQNGTPQNPPTGSQVSGTVDRNPTFPTPGGGSGSSTSSQPPAESTPSLGSSEPVSTPTGEPTPPQGGQLTVQITSIPSQVFNNTTVVVTVTANEPGAQVSLQVRYNVPPYLYSSGQRITDGNGNATIPWHVRVERRLFIQVIAIVVAVATDQNGQQAVSPPVEVQVSG